MSAPPRPRTWPFHAPLATILSLFLLLASLRDNEKGYPGPWCNASDITHGVRHIAELPFVHDPVDGGTAVVLAGHAADGMRDMEVRLVTLSPGSASPIHSHPNEEVIVSMSGEGWLRTLPVSSSGAPLPSIHPLGPNCTATLAPGLVHQIESDSDTTLKLLVTISDPPSRPHVFPSWEEAASAVPASAEDPQTGTAADVATGTEAGTATEAETGSEEGTGTGDEAGSEAGGETPVEDSLGTVAGEAGDDSWPRKDEL